MPPPKYAGPGEAIESPTGGAKPMSIAGRLIHERERLSGMNDAERAWRKQWLKDQTLTPREPLFIPKDSPHLLNPIRKMYRWPLDQVFFKFLKPIIGDYRARVGRFYVGRGLMGLWGVYLTIYYFEYNANDWTKRNGWRTINSRTAAYPGDANYPNTTRREHPRDYNDRGFKDGLFGKKYDNANRGFDDDAPVEYKLT